MPVTGDPNAVAIVTFKGTPLSMGDCFIKITPMKDRTQYTVTGQFFAVDASSPHVISGAARAAGESYLDDVITLVGGVADLVEFDGPLGKRLLIPSGYVVGNLVNPFTNKTYSDLVLTEVNSSDTGGKTYPVEYTFVKPLSVANDGTTGSTVSFAGTAIGNRGGTVRLSADGVSLKVSVTSYYVKGTLDPEPLDYFQSLANTLDLNAFTATPLPRGDVGNRVAIKSYRSTIANLSWTGKGTITAAVLEGMEFSEDTPGIFTLTSSFIAKR